MPTEVIQVEIRNRVALVTLNRPERLNAMNDELLNALPGILRELAADRSAGCLVLTGAGRAFCAGGDITRMVAAAEPVSFEEQVEQQQSWHSAAALLHDMRKPVIAMVNGAAAGAGLSLAMACDIRIAGASARFGAAFVRVGFSGDFGGAWLLTQLVGTARAREIYYTGEIIGADEALRLGLVNRVVPDEALREQTLALAGQIAAGPAVALGYMKENLNLSQHARLQDVLDAEARSHRRTGQTVDHKEAARAFLEKRQPVFQGR